MTCSSGGKIKGKEWEELRGNQINTKTQVQEGEGCGLREGTEGHQDALLSLTRPKHGAQITWVLLKVRFGV